MRSLIPWRVRHGGALDTFRNEMEDLARRFFGEEENGGATWAPRVDVEETEKEILVKADLPGVEPKDVEISVTDNALMVRGEKKEEREEKKKHYHRMERFAGSFYREVPLPTGADLEKISANSSKGVITVTIPKKPEVMAKKIMVKPKE